MHTLDVWYYRVDTDLALAVFEKASSKKGRKSAQKMVKKARSHTHQQTLEKLTQVDSGRRWIRSDPPLLVPFREIDFERILDDADARQITKQTVENAWAQYLDSLPDERRYLLQRFRLVDAALRVGGVGSVGTRCMIALLEGLDNDDALLLQLKEAGPSVLERYSDRPASVGSARRVVTGQRLMQATPDIFLGWHTSKFSGQDFYWRQLKDMKGSADVEDMDVDALQTYIQLCSWCLARAHARTGDEAAIRAYIGKNDTFAQAIAGFATGYADQTERDYQRLVEAVESGRIAAEPGV